MPHAYDVLTPDSLAMLQVISETGSFAAAARHLGLVPSALTYRVRQIEDALDVLLFDRTARQARPTEAGAELLREGVRLLREIDADNYDPIRSTATAAAVHSRAELWVQSVRWQAPTWATTFSRPPLTSSGMNVVQVAWSPDPPTVMAPAWQPSWL